MRIAGGLCVYGAQELQGSTSQHDPEAQLASNPLSYLDAELKENYGSSHMGGCQKYGPFLGPYYNTAPIIWGTQKGTFILTTTHMT